MLNKNISKSSVKERIIKCVKDALPGTTKTCIWIVKLTVIVSFIIVILQYLDILPWISNLLNPIFNIIGLPGEAALPFVTGYFVNVYAAISVMVSFDFDIRVITILSVMILSAHNMITETAVQKKTGSSAVRMVIIRTFSAFLMAFVLNKLLPGESGTNFYGNIADERELMTVLKDWFFSTITVVIKIVVLIYSLGILQRILSEFGVINIMAKLLKPFLIIFGLPSKTAFLWIVANILGLAYGAAIMIDESRSGKINKKDINLLNSHIAISHSNLEDLMLLASIGGVWYILLLTRWACSMLLVWELKLEYYIKENFINNNR